MSTNRGMDKEAVEYMYNQISLSLNEEWNNAIGSHLDGPRSSY